MENGNGHVSLTVEERAALRAAIDRERRRREGLPTLEALEIEERKRRFRERERELLRQRWRRLKGDPAYSKRYHCLSCQGPVSNRSGDYARKHGRTPRCRECWIREQNEARLSRWRCSECDKPITVAGFRQAEKAGRPPRCASCGQRASWADPEKRRRQSERQKARRAREKIAA